MAQPPLAIAFSSSPLSFPEYIPDAVAVCSGIFHRPCEISFARWRRVPSSALLRPRPFVHYRRARAPRAAAHPQLRPAQAHPRPPGQTRFNLPRARAPKATAPRKLKKGRALMGMRPDTLRKARAPRATLFRKLRGATPPKSPRQVKYYRALSKDAR